MRRKLPLITVACILAPWALFAGVICVLTGHTHWAAGLLAFVAVTMLEAAAFAQPTGGNRGKAQD